MNYKEIYNSADILIKDDEYILIRQLGKLSASQGTRKFV
jgi:hypothetical protein